MKNRGTKRNGEYLVFFCKIFHFIANLSTEHSCGNKIISRKVATFLREKGHKSYTNKPYSINKKEGEVKNDDRKDKTTNFSLRVT
jgi:hypothetical protein